MNMASPQKHTAQMLTWTCLSGTGCRNEFPEAWLPCTLMKLRCSSHLSPAARLRFLLFPFLQTVSELRTDLMIRELIRKRWQWAFTALNFHQPIFHISLCNAECKRARETDVGCLWMMMSLLQEETGGPFAPDSRQQGQRKTLNLNL